MKCIKNIESIAPEDFWRNFDKVLSIPHPSGHEQELIEYLKTFSDNLNLKYTVDKAGNILIKKPASPEKKDAPTVVLQAHLDMVPQKNHDIKHDFSKDPISAYVENGWVKTNGTTLGADNGTGVASIMSILENTNIKHGSLEALLTVEEEVGMRGANNLAPNLLTGKYMINLDCGPDDNIIIGCAGGGSSEITFTYSSEKIVNSNKYTFLKLSVKGLKGGHSAGDIPRQRGNANKILFRILYKVNKKFEIKISNIDSGGLKNAIPREGSVVFGFNKSEENELVGNVNSEIETIKNELQNSDSNLYHELIPMPTPETVIDNVTLKNLISSIHICHNGLIRMIDKDLTRVETSTNLASVKLDSTQSSIKIVFLTRSLVLSQRILFYEKLDALFELAGASRIIHSKGSPAWLPHTDSKLLAITVNLYKKMFNSVPVQKIIHGGLECGIISNIYPKMELLAIGPITSGAHSPNEELNISSMEKNYNFLIALLAEL